MKQVLTLTALLIACLLQAQNHLIGAKGGVHFSNVVNKLRGQLGDENFRTGASAGFTYDFLFKKHFSAGADLMYVQRGFRTPIYFTDVNGIQTDEGRIKLNYDYVAIPIKLGIHAGKKFYGFVNVALVPAILVNAKMKEPVADDKGEVTGYRSSGTYKDVRPYDLSGMLEAGTGYKLKEAYWLFLSCTAQGSVLPLYRAKGSATFLQYGIALQLGFKYVLPASKGSAKPTKTTG